MQARLGRTVYEQNCQVCHGPDLKGDRGPAIDTAVSRLGADGISDIIAHGRGAMPALPTVLMPAIAAVTAFLKQPDLAPPGTGVGGNAFTERIAPHTWILGRSATRPGMARRATSLPRRGAPLPPTT
jgi:quinoprotein glucose dehydrogenase